MQQQTDRDGPRTRAGKRRLRTLDELDQRTAAYRRAQQLVSGLESDLGGPEQLSTAQREIAKHAALLGAQLEDLECRWISGEPISLGDYSTLVNTQRRSLVTVGLERVPKDISDEQSQLRELLDLAREPEEIASP